MMELAVGHEATIGDLGGATSRAASLGAVREGRAGFGDLVAPPFRPWGSRAVASAI